MRHHCPLYVISLKIILFHLIKHISTKETRLPGGPDHVKQASLVSHKLVHKDSPECRCLTLRTNPQIHNLITKLNTNETCARVLKHHLQGHTIQGSPSISDLHECCQQVWIQSPPEEGSLYTNTSTFHTAPHQSNRTHRLHRQQTSLTHQNE